MTPTNLKLQNWREKNPQANKNLSKQNSKAYRERNKGNELFKLKEKLRQKEIYAKKKNITSLSLNDEGFKSRNSLMSSMRKIKRIMPKSTQKRKELVVELNKEFPGLCQPIVKPPKVRSLSQASKLAIEFYQKSENSLILPGKNDTMIRRNEEGKKEKIQKQVFTKSVDEMFDEFKKEGHTLSRSQFFHHAPKNILSFTKMPFFSCLCKSHENFKLVFNGVKSNLSDKGILTHRNFYEVNNLIISAQHSLIKLIFRHLCARLIIIIAQRIDAQPALISQIS